MKSFRMEKFDGNKDVTRETAGWGLVLLLLAPLFVVLWIFSQAIS